MIVVLVVWVGVWFLGRGWGGGWLKFGFKGRGVRGEPPYYLKSIIFGVDKKFSALFCYFYVNHPSLINKYDKTEKVNNEKDLFARITNKETPKTDRRTRIDRKTDKDKQ